MASGQDQQFSTGVPQDASLEQDQQIPTQGVRQDASFEQDQQIPNQVPQDASFEQDQQIPTQVPQDARAQQGQGFDQTPDQTFQQTPKQTPDDETSRQTFDQTSGQTPNPTPDQTLQQTPEDVPSTYDDASTPTGLDDTTVGDQAPAKPSTKEKISSKIHQTGDKIKASVAGIKEKVTPSS